MRRRGGDCTHRPILWQRHDDLSGVEVERRCAGHCATPVDPVPGDRPAHCSRMNPNLMRAACQRLELDKGEGPLIPTRAAPCDPPPRLRRHAAGIDLHPPSAAGLQSSERQVNEPFLLLGMAFDHGPVGLADAPLLKKKPKLFQRLAMPAQNQAARGVTVEAVRQRWVARQAVPQRAEEILEARFRFSWMFVDRDAGWLVYDEDQSIPVQDARLHRPIREPFFRDGFPHHAFRCHAGKARSLGAALRAAAQRFWMAEADDTSTKPGLFGRLFGRARDVEVAADATPQAAPPEPKRSWWQRLREGLSRSSGALGQGIAEVFTKRRLDAAAIDDLEDMLLRADLGLPAATRITTALSRGRFDREIAPDEIRAVLSAEVEASLAPVAKPLVVDGEAKPFVILVVGVNGSGKTTTIAKLTSKFVAEGRRVMLAAGDTFRAAAVEQLKVWGGRLGAPVVSRATGADAAGLAFDALTEARQANADVLLVDTAGRLQNRTELMAELEKIVRVMRKVDAAAPHAVLLVLDATVGQNALSQVEIFSRVAGVTGLVMTKLDGTARGGILVAIADKFGLPIHYIGVGESADDLEPFAARDFAHAIAGLEREQPGDAA